MHNDLLPTTIEGKLARLTEECAEVIKCVSKGTRFGWSRHTHNGVEYDNLTDLQEEMKDLEHAIIAVRNISLDPTPQTKFFRQVMHDHNCGNMGGGCDCGAK